jgi:hypothetical protein
MELIDQYLEKVEKVHGIYVLQVDDECTAEDKSNIANEWQDVVGDKHKLLILPNKFEINFIERYSFYVALMLVRGGKKVTRDTWVKELMEEDDTTYLHRLSSSRNKVSYLTLSEEGQVVRRLPGHDIDVVFNLTLEDMDAEDYVMV